MQDKISQLYTASEIARALGAPVHRVIYILGTRHFIQLCARAGRLRLYDRQAMQQIAEELDRDRN